MPDRHLPPVAVDAEIENPTWQHVWPYTATAAIKQEAPAPAAKEADGLWRQVWPYRAVEAKTEPKPELEVLQPEAEVDQTWRHVWPYVKN